MKRRRRIAFFLAAAVSGSACVGETDPPTSSITGLPSSDQRWRLENLGLPRINRGPLLPQGAVGGYINQLILTSPITGEITLSGRLWVRLGPDLQHLSSPSRQEYQALHMACDTETLGSSSASFAESCQTTSSTDPWVSGCRWPMHVEAGNNEIRLHCRIQSDGEARAFTIGVLELSACIGAHCDLVTINPAVRYQAGADITPPPNDIIAFVTTP